MDFFPSAKRTLFRKALVKLKRLEGMAIETATQRLESDELERKMAAALNSVSTSGDSSGNSPVSSA